MKRRIKNRSLYYYIKAVNERKKELAYPNYRKYRLNMGLYSLADLWIEMVK